MGNRRAAAFHSLTAAGARTQHPCNRLQIYYRRTGLWLWGEAGHESNNSTAGTRMTRAEFNLIRIASTVALGGFLVGFDATVISGAVPFIRDYFDLGGPSGSLKLGWAVSCLGWGAMAGNLAAGPLSDRFGRRSVCLRNLACGAFATLPSTLGMVSRCICSLRLCCLSDQEFAIGTGVCNLCAGLRRRVCPHSNTGSQDCYSARGIAER